MLKTIGATEVRNNLGQLLNRVYRGEEQLVVEKLGIPVAAIISIADFEEYRRLSTAAALRDVSRRIGAQVKRQGITEETLRQEMEQDREAVYDEFYGQGA